ncbi:MAG: ATP-binding protein [Alphaproteobacteria bacterium]
MDWILGRSYRRLGRAGRRKAGRVALPYAVLATIAVVAIGILSLHTARVADRYAAEASLELAGSNLAAEARALGVQAKDKSWWDAAIENLFVRFDARWADDNLGWYLKDTFGVDASIIVAADDTTTVAYVAGRPDPRPSSDIVSHGIGDLVARARAAPMGEPAPATGYALVDGRPAIVAASAFTPQNPTAEQQTRQARPVLVLARFLGDTLFAAIHERSLLDDLHLLAPDEAPRPETLQLDIAAIDGTLLGRLGWIPSRPGSDVLGSIMPYAILRLLAVAVIATLFVGRLIALVGQIDAQAEELAASEQRFRDFAGAASDWFWETDADRRFVFVSRTVGDAANANPAWVVGRRWPELAAPGEIDRQVRWDDDVLSRREAFRDLVARQDMAGGREVYLKISGLPKLAADGTFVGFRGTCTDITTEIEARRNSREAEAKLAQSAKLATLGEMAAGLVHELNQPLNVIRVTADDTMMAMEAGAGSAEEIRDAIGTVRTQTSRMAGIIHNMRIFSRDGYGRRETFDVRAAVTDALSMVRSDLVKSGIRVETIVPDRDHLVWGQQLRLEQVLLNLLSNAADQIRARHARNPGRRPGQPAGSIIIAVDRDGANSVTIAVADDGGGIAPEHLPRIFDPFFTTKAPGQGTGLGLSISYGIVASMGGELSARNVGDGARFEIALPAHGEGARASPGAPPAET